MSLAEQPLRILVVVNLPWDVRLGATRVWFELAEQWRARGATVEKYTLSDAFPAATSSRVIYALREVIFGYKAAAFVRMNAARFDVIDALVGALPASKRRLRFRGLLVARSVGLYLLYEKFNRVLAQKWPNEKKGRIVGRIFYRVIRMLSHRASAHSLRHADLINVPNDEEASCVHHEFGADRPVLVQPYGLTPEQVRTFRQNAAPAAARLAHQKVCFVGMWSPRKGARDWAEIIRGVRQRVPAARFLFLGTMVDEAAVRADLGVQSPDVGVEFVSKYEPEDLPHLLGDSTVGAFPSYVEGFGLAVIEQLAAGIPTVAYDTAGPRHILSGQFPELLIASGDVGAFAAALAQVLLLDADAYAALVAGTLEALAPFSWPQIADATLADYRSRLREAQQQPVNSR